MAIVNDEQVMKVLQQYNPWWRTPSAIKEESKPQKRLAYYEALKTLTHKSLRRFAVLSGMRRVGKTTILYQIIDHLIDEGVNPGNILYATFDNPILKLVNAENVLSIYEANLRQSKGYSADRHGIRQPCFGKGFRRQRYGAVERS